MISRLESLAFVCAGTLRGAAGGHQRTLTRADILVRPSAEVWSGSSSSWALMTRADELEARTRVDRSRVPQSAVEMAPQETESIVSRAGHEETTGVDPTRGRTSLEAAGMRASRDIAQRVQSRFRFSPEPKCVRLARVQHRRSPLQRGTGWNKLEWKCLYLKDQAPQEVNTQLRSHATGREQRGGRQCRRTGSGHSGHDVVRPCAWMARVLSAGSWILDPGQPGQGRVVS